MEIRSALPSDAEAVLEIERRAFGENDEAELVEALLGDPTAQPTVSLLAEAEGRPVGHILFTRGEIVSTSGLDSVAVSVLAPLAVVPEWQRQGVGGALVRAGLDRVRESGLGIALVLGHVDYYPRYGFTIAAERGIYAPYPTDPIEAFMVLETAPGALEGVSGTLKPCDTFMRPEYWRE